MHSALRSLLGFATLTAAALQVGAPALAQAGTAGPVQGAPKQPEAPRAGAPDGQAAPEVPSPEFVVLQNAWKGVFHDYSVELLRYDRANAAKPPDKRDPKGPPLHPARAWWARFDELGRKADPDALRWQLEQAPNAFAEPAQCANAAEKVFDALLAAHPGHSAVENGLDALRPLWDAFGRERFIALVRRVHEKALGPENQAHALLIKAWAVSNRHKDHSPEREHEVQEIYEEIMLGYPGTRTARQVAGNACSGLESSFLEAELAWIDTVRELQKQGKGPKDWPRQPMYAWYEKYLPLANAGSELANDFVNETFPGYQQAEGNGIGIGLVWLQSFWMLNAPAGAEGWLRARLGLIEIVARQFHGQPLVTSAMVDLARDALMMPLEYLEPALAPVLADDSAPKAQALALCSRALARTTRNQSADWQAARADLELLLRKYPSEEIAGRAQSLLDSMLNVWPGSPAPDFRGTDQDGLAFKLQDYRGFVTVIDFCSTAGGLAADGIARRAELIQSFQGRPLRWLGGFCEGMSRRTFLDSLGSAGVKWRCALLNSFLSDVATLWSIRILPTIFVVDPEGVIRGRNLPWDEQQALIEKLVSEAEKKREKH